MMTNRGQDGTRYASDEAPTCQVHTRIGTPAPSSLTSGAVAIPRDRQRRRSRQVSPRSPAKLPERITGLADQRAQSGDVGSLALVLGDHHPPHRQVEVTPHQRAV